MRYLAAVEVDRRQEFILRSDKLREMKGASAIIADTVELAYRAVRDKGLKMVRPASGAIWIGGDDLQQIGDALWKLRRKFVDDAGMSATFAIIQTTNNPNHDRDELEIRLRRNKDSKSGENGAPALPFFAQCGIQPELPANRWEPTKYPNELRRRLVSEVSRNCLKKSREYRSPIEGLRAPADFDDLVVSKSGDSYIAFIKADVDGLGRLQAELKLDEARDPWESMRRFSCGIDNALKNAVDRAMAEGAASVRQGGCFPFIKLVVAGDDLWILARRDKAFDLARRIDEEFRAECEKVAEIPKGSVSLSFGILFAKKGYPFDAQFDLANEVLREAKQKRRKENSKEGWVDYHWLESSSREHLAEIRSTTLLYKEESPGDAEFKLFTRPWKLSDLRAILDTSEKLRAAAARRKLRQLETILRLGEGASQLAVHQWWQHLEKTERKAIGEALAGLPDALRPDTGEFAAKDCALGKGPWKPSAGAKRVETSLLELIEVGEIVHVVREPEPGPAQPDEEEDQE